MEAGLERIESADSIDRPPFIERVLLLDEGRPNMLDAARAGAGILFTPNRVVKAGMLKQQGICARNAILLLAAAGLEITDPNLTIDIARSEEIVRIREELAEEKRDYIISVTRVADETYDRLTSGVYQDTVDWALSEAFFKIRPKAMRFEISLKKLNRNLLERVTLGFLKDGIPAVGRVFIDKGLKDGVMKSSGVLLETLCRNLALQIEERRHIEVVYGMKVSKELLRGC